MSEAYALFGISKNTLYRLIHKGTISHINLGTNQIRVSKEELQKLYPLRRKALTKSKNPVCLLPFVQYPCHTLYAYQDVKIQYSISINDNLEKMAKQLYDYWFVQFDFPDGNGRPYKSSGGAMVWNEKLRRDIPIGWDVKTLSEQVKLEDYKRIPLSKKERSMRQGIYPYYGATEIMDYIDDYIFDGDYLLLAEDGSTSDVKGFPVVQYIWGKNWVNNHAHIIIPNIPDHILYWYFTLRSIPAKLIETGSIQKKISQENLLPYKTLAAPKVLVDRFSLIAIPLQEKRKLCIEEINKLTKQRDELLPLLMNGQASVNYHLSYSFAAISILYRHKLNDIENEKSSYTHHCGWNGICFIQRAA